MAARRVRLAAVGVAATAAAALALPGATLAAAAPRASQGRVLPAPTLPAGTRVLAATPAAERVQASIVLQPRNAPALAAFARSVTDVRSARFRHYLARGEFTARFGPTASSIGAVERFAAAAGLRVGALSSNHLVLTVSGPAARFDLAFATRLSQVRLPDGTVGRVTTAPVRLPAAVAPSIVAVVGLDDVLHARTWTKRPTHLRRPYGTHVGREFPTSRPRAIPGAPSACTSASDVTRLGFGGITDDQIAHAYGADGLYSAGDLGQNQTIAIFELEPYLRSDVAAFDTCYFGADHTSNITTINVDHGPGSGAGGGEAALDIEDVSALAPNAKILVYQAPNTSSGSLDAYNKIVADDRAQVTTTSWGFCERDQLALSPGAMDAENLIFEQAAAQGQTVFNASGDAGDDACAYSSAFPSSPVLTVADPASQPYVIGVGGTTAVSVAQPPAEQTWNDGAFGGASTGGVSALWEQPPWMASAASHLSSTSPCHAAAGQVCRTTPDVSAFADEFTGVTIYWDGQWGTIGGTSSASPIWAAMLALVNESATCRASVRTANGVGFAAPLLYRVAQNPMAYASGFNDVTLGNNDVFGLEHGKYPALPGYDLATGLGTPQLTPAPHASGPGLATSLCAAAQGGTTATIASITPTAGPALGHTPFTITGTGFMTGSTPDVTAVDFGTSPAATFTVLSSTKIIGTTSSASTPTTSSRLNGLTLGAGLALVSVTTTDSSVVVGPKFRYFFQRGAKPVPELLQIGPTGGPAAGGTTVHLYGTGFTGATRVTFGGEQVPPASIKVISDVQIDVVVPRLTTAACLPEGAATLGLCQTEVRVATPGGASATVPAKKPFTGVLNLNNLGQVLVPRTCGCEAYPTVTEFDYATSVALRSITSPSGARVVGDPNGGNLVTLHGTGLNVLTLNWVNFGPAGVASSFDPFVAALSGTGTALQVSTLGDPNPGPAGDSTPVSLNTVAGTSGTVPFAYAPVPLITSLSTSVLPAAGGTTLTITGGGFSRVNMVAFSPFDGADPPVTILKNFTVVSPNKITLPSPSMVPTAYQVVVCDIYTCASGDPTKPSTWTVDVIFPGATAVTSATAVPSGAEPITGPVTGGTPFKVQGTNFGPIAHLHVYLVNALGEMVAATGVTATGGVTDPGATQAVTATSPAALAGDPEFYAIVLVGDDGTSAETATALFSYH